MLYPVLLLFVLPIAIPLAIAVAVLWLSRSAVWALAVGAVMVAFAAWLWHGAAGGCPTRWSAS